MNLLKSIFFIFPLSTITSNAQELSVSSEQIANAEIFDIPDKAQSDRYTAFKKKAFEAHKNEKYFSCLVAINDAQSIIQDDTDLFYLQGVCHAQLQDVDRAIEYYEKVLAIKPTHSYTLINIIEINFFSGRYEEAAKYINLINSRVDAKDGRKLPLLDFKLLISLTKLSENDPTKYNAEKDKIISKYTYMDDNPFYYYSNALKLLAAGEKQKGRIWIMKAHRVFRKSGFIKSWNKALIDSGYLDAYEISYESRKNLADPKSRKR